MAANAHLPIIGSLDVSEGERGRGTAVKGEGDQRRLAKKKPTVSFLSRLQLGSLQQFPQPGDVYHGSMTSRHTRPLGLLPDHNDRLAALKKLNALLSPWSVGRRPTAPRHNMNTTWPPANSEQTEDTVTDTISTTIHLRHKSGTPLDLSGKITDSQSDGMKDITAYRLSQRGLSEAAPLAGKKDPDYMGDKASEYYALIGMAPLPTLSTTVQQGLLQFNTSTSYNQKGEKKTAKLKR